ncbi:MAG: Sec-independent protein translocase TatA [Sphingomonadaceae bacterium]|nr:Sec-independent protein translocase TatA [Sphingomonadaceae bacterium]
MGGFSPLHILILAIVAVLLLGGGRFSNLMGDVAKGVKNFKKGMAEEDGAPRSSTVPPPPSMIEGRSAADIIAEHERQKAAAAQPVPPSDPAA